ncbi:MAG: hypothetical protein IPH53_22730 [Flavobacteriales bacterium]|nr:hypothetical protein [Flavobacteriales bacterium]
MSAEEQPQYDAVMMSGYVSHTGTGDEYGRIPSAQYDGDMNVGGSYTNPGVQDQTNVVVTALGGPINASTSTPLLLTDETLFMDEVVAVALPEAMYNCTLAVSSDQIAQDAFPLNNVYLRNFEITSDVYSLDGIGNHPAGYESLTATGTNSFTDNEDQLYLMSMYYINAPMTVYGIEVMRPMELSKGAPSWPALHDTTEVLNDNVLSPLVSSPEHIVSAWDISEGRAGSLSPTHTR